jgi:preprotein translocase subunit SecE
MDRLRSIFSGIATEMREHVTWPPRQELQNSTVLVLVASLIFALVIGVVDFGFKNLMEAIYTSFTA